MYVLNLRLPSLREEWTTVFMEQYMCFNEHAAHMAIVLWLSEWVLCEYVPPGHLSYNLPTRLGQNQVPVLPELTHQTHL
jgi:hypothetical protein